MELSSSRNTYQHQCCLLPPPFPRGEAHTAAHRASYTSQVLATRPPPPIMAPSPTTPPIRHLRNLNPPHEPSSLPRQCGKVYAPRELNSPPTPLHSGLPTFWSGQKASKPPRGSREKFHPRAPQEPCPLGFTRPDFAPPARGVARFIIKHLTKKKKMPSFRLG